MTKPPAPGEVSSGFTRVGARLAPLGKWPLEAAVLSVVPGAKNFSTDSLYNERQPPVIPPVSALSEIGSNTPE
ncbi:hypothetical protein RQN9TF_33295 (plasmid) [Rhodococcus qingshengii]|uniref:hypothetical protein n=1 Tax=Rhodococcus TaxID=1827 RepID=UPI000F623C94|nr:MULTISPECIES: hypothetical protein [Rhodococcus]AZI66095.1 hypothetical protein EHW12_34340 [Rhodococcus sp. NJ-530]BDQ24140.1 hypothetical protein RQN9TF_33295 [Rhodococcus qingshengii]